MEPFGPATAVNGKVMIENDAPIVWFAVTLSKRYEATGPTETLSTCTSAMKYPTAGVIVVHRRVAVVDHRDARGGDAPVRGRQGGHGEGLHREGGDDRVIFGHVGEGIRSHRAHRHRVDVDVRDEEPVAGVIVNDWSAP